MIPRLPTRVQQALIIAVGVLLAGAMVLLGVWQLDVYHQQGAAASARRAAAPPVSLREVAPAGAAITDGFGRSVVFSGSYDPALQLVAGNPDGTPGSRVLTGLRQADGSVVAVVRGVLPPGTSIAPAPPTGVVQQTGLLLPSEDATGAGSPGQLGSVRLPLLAQQWPGPLVGGFVTLSAPDAQAQGLSAATIELPESSGRLRNGAYAVQWWVFAAFAVIMALRMARDFGRTEPDLTEIDADAAPDPT